jgi:hypothetical protein
MPPAVVFSDQPAAIADLFEAPGDLRRTGTNGSTNSGMSIAIVMRKPGAGVAVSTGTSLKTTR